MPKDLASEVKHLYDQLTLPANKRLHFSLIAASPVSYVPGGIATYLLAEHGIDPSINVAITALAKSSTNLITNLAVYHCFTFGHSSIKSTYENSVNLFKTLAYSSLFGIPYLTFGILGYLCRVKFHLHDGMAAFTPRGAPSIKHGALTTFK